MNKKFSVTGPSQLVDEVVTALAAKRGITVSSSQEEIDRYIAETDGRLPDDATAETVVEDAAQESVLDFFREEAVAYDQHQIAVQQRAEKRQAAIDKEAAIKGARAAITVSITDA